MWNQIRNGCVANIPVAFSVAAYGSVLGVLAAQKNIDLVTLFLMNISIFAGAAQFVMVDMWLPPLPIVEITLAVLAINSRYLLIGASLRPVFTDKSFWHKISVMHLVADENWAVTIAAHRRGQGSSFFLLGGGICLLFAWTTGTMAGCLLGAVMENPEAYALDFAFVTVFTAITVSLWRGKTDAFPWLVAAAFAIVAERLLPGKWYIIIGGVGGALITLIPVDKIRLAALPKKIFWNTTVQKRN